MGVDEPQAVGVPWHFKPQTVQGYRRVEFGHRPGRIAIEYRLQFIGAAFLACDRKADISAEVAQHEYFYGQTQQARSQHQLFGAQVPCTQLFQHVRLPVDRQHHLSPSLVQIAQQRGIDRGEVILRPAQQNNGRKARLYASFHDQQRLGVGDAHLDGGFAPTQSQCGQKQNELNAGEKARGVGHGAGH